MELQGVIVLVITIEELDPSSKPCYVIERGAQGGSYKRIDDKDVPLSSTEVLTLASYGRATPSDRDAVAGAGADNLDETLVDRTDRSGFLVDAPGNARRAGQTNEAGAPKYP